jgi:hypothetical protein
MIFSDRHLLRNTTGNTGTGKSTCRYHGHASLQARSEFRPHSFAIGLAFQRLNDKVAHHAAVVGVHARAVDVENARNLDDHTVLAAVAKKQGIGTTLAFVVPRARADGVHIAPVSFRCEWSSGSP